MSLDLEDKHNNQYLTDITLKSLITCESVTFSYESRPPILKDFRLDLKKEETTYFEGGKLYHNSTVYNSLYGIEVNLGANAIYEASLTMDACASPLVLFTDTTAGFQRYIAKQLSSAGAQAEVYFSRYRKYRTTITSLFGVFTSVKAWGG